MASRPLKWHGGKEYLAKRIVALMPSHLHYVEPFFGGGAVLFTKPAVLVEGHSEVVNDIAGELIDFWRVLQADSLFADFRRLVEAVPFAEQEFGRAYNRVSCRAVGTSNLPELEKEYGWRLTRAVMFFIRYRQSRQGLGKDFATLSRNRTRRGMNEQASAWLSAVEGLPEIHERLKRVVILNNDAVKVIRQQDGPNTLFYCDPPYLQETRVTKNDYQHEMTLEQHLELLEVLRGTEGDFILSGYRNEHYDGVADVARWRRVDFEIDCKASGKKQKPKRVESVWMNYAAD